jgi:hypothetical protein
LAVKALIFIVKAQMAASANNARGWNFGRAGAAG